MKNILFSFVITLSVLFLGMSQTGVALATGGASGTGDTPNCQNMYGGGKNCESVKTIIINKTVKNPASGQFVDNLTVNDPKYGPNQIVTFQISVTNTGNETIHNAKVTDIFPEFVSFQSGVGSFDAQSKVLSFDVVDLKAGETRTFTVTGKTAEDKNLPQNQTTTCVTNQSTVTIHTMTNQDNASFCIQKGMMTTKGGLVVYPPTNVTSTPATGAESLPLMLSSLGGLIGFFFKKNAK